MFLSPAGAELAERLYTHVRRSLSPMTSELDPAEQRRLQALLERLLSRLGATANASPGER